MSAPLLRRIAGRRQLLVGAVLTAAIVGIAILSQFWTPEVPTRMRFALKLKGPLVQGLLGTDHFGRDLTSMLMVGAWNSLSIGVLAVAVGASLGTLLGVSAAARGGLLEGAIMRLCDILFAFPAVLSAIVLGALMGPGAFTAVIAIGVFMIPVFARVTRGAAAQVWARDYVLAARAAGKGQARITLEHVLPNIASQIIVQATIQLGLAILTEAGLSFLGLGIAPPAPSWGRMLADAQTYLSAAPHLALVPGIAIALSVLGFNLLGDGLRDLIDPRRRLGG
ncbi:peptide/nickel transport system permease protein [Azorhizobium sp. AG788]|uniref:ABC transporter permease n=1 Tax=Azorhizobium sp. AG788 TaxID=2183897 RepID=UPI00105DC863|nr:ABC transporter permease [Azorhizobium sp. AG788]TDT99847.1 peptide/nickel transport system permease protein [Azorhizobium sp. AG788]